MAPTWFRQANLIWRRLHVGLGRWRRVAAARDLQRAGGSSFLQAIHPFPLAEVGIRAPRSARG